MPGPRVAFVVDHPQRDLAGLTLTAGALCEAGAVCHLVPLKLQRRELWALAPDLAVLNYLRAGNERLAADLTAAGVRVAVLDTEGGVWPDADSYSELLARDAAARAEVHRLCMWGETLARHVVDRGLFRAEQVRVTGCPRFDFYAPAWRSVLADAPPGPERPRLLLNTSFSLMNPRFASTEENVAQCRVMYGWSEERTRRYLDAQREAVTLMVELARSLARRYPGADVVVRPHPFERIEPYAEGLRDVANASLNLDGPVQPQIYRAAAVVQRSCSTAIEAGFAGVPALSPLWIPAAEPIEAAERVSVPCASPEAMYGVIDDVLAGAYRPSEEIAAALATTIERWFHRVDGRAHERVAETLLQTVPVPGRVRVDRCRRHLYGLGIASASRASRLARRARHLLRLPPDWPAGAGRGGAGDRWGASDKSFDAAAVQLLLDRMRAARRARDDVAVRAVRARAARECGEYVHRFAGHAVALAAEV